MDILEVDEAINEKLREMIQTEYISEADNQPPVICSDDREKEEESQRQRCGHACTRRNPSDERLSRFLHSRGGDADEEEATSSVG